VNISLTPIKDPWNVINCDSSSLYMTAGCEIEVHIKGEGCIIGFQIFCFSSLTPYIH
jgi:hypothetical protein